MDLSQARGMAGLMGSGDGNEEKHEEVKLAKGEEHPDSIWNVLRKIDSLDFGDTKEKYDELMGKFLLGRTIDPTRTLKGISREDRNAHFHVIGGSGTGKSRFLESLIAQDMHKKMGFGVLDPHGDLVKDVKAMIILLRQSISYSEDRVVLIDPTDPEYSVCLNPLEPVEGVPSAVIAAELIDAFAKIWGNSWGARMQEIFRNTLVALIENRLTLREVPLILNNVAVRRKLLANVKDELCLEFFEKYERWNEREKRDYTESTLNKLDDFMANPSVRDIFLSPYSSFDLRDVMDTGKTLLVNLDRGQLKGASDLLGSLILSKIQMAAFSRSNVADDKRVPFHVYIDEFQDFASENFVRVLSQSRKYGLFFTLAHQDFAQLPRELRASVLSNCKLTACFRVSRDDADVMAKELYGGVYDEPQEWEPRIQRIQKLIERQFLFKNKEQGGIAVLEAFDTPLIWKERFATREDYEEYGGGWGEVDMGINTQYKREEIRAEYAERRKVLGASDDLEIFKENKPEEMKGVDYEKMIKGGENNHVEFKEVLRLAHEGDGKDKIMEHAVAKAISAFMNSEGGTLFIGVRDDGAITGIEQDYAALKGNKDSFLLHLTNAINNYLGKEFNQYASVSVVPIEGKDICVVEVSPSAMPVFLKNGNKEEFYVRASASSQSMSVREGNEYIKTHFAERI